MARIDMERQVRAPLSHLYRAFTNSTDLRGWLCDAAQVRPQKGGRLHMWWTSGYYATGEYLELVPDQMVRFTWRGRGEPGETRVTVELQPEGDATTVRLCHKRVGDGKKWADAAAGIRRGWERGLDNLQSVLESGHDLRLTQRPMLGIYPEPLTPEAITRLGVPVKKGTLISSVVEGLAAQAAGLNGGDVITRVGEAKVADWAALQSALGSHRAGDEVPVTYYRGSEKLTATVTLSARSIEEPPATPEALAEAYGKSAADFLARLEETLGGVGEDAAGRRPGPGEWSAKDVLCHLIAGERATQEWVVDIVGGQERWSDDWVGNLDIAHAGLLAVYPTTAELLEELKRNTWETRAMVAALPEEFVARRGAYWQTAHGLMEAPAHNQDHLEQIKQALAAGSG